MESNKLLLDEGEALEALGIGRTLFKKLLADGSVPSVRLGRRRLYPVASLERFVEERTEAGYGN